MIRIPIGTRALGTSALERSKTQYTGAPVRETLCHLQP